MVMKEKQKPGHYLFSMGARRLKSVDDDSFPLGPVLMLIAALLLLAAAFWWRG